MNKPSMPAASIGSQQTRPMIAPADLEGAREKERALQQRRAGYASTIATRGGGGRQELGILNLQKTRALGRTA